MLAVLGSIEEEGSIMPMQARQCVVHTVTKLVTVDVIMLTMPAAMSCLGCGIAHLCNPLRLCKCGHVDLW
jgi:hypothetical protein